MELKKMMLKINRLEQKIAAISNDIDNRYKMLICKDCDLPVTHLLVTGLGQFPNCSETLICNECVRYINSLNCYQLDIISFVGLYKLT